MLYLKNTLGGWSRSLTESALQTLQGASRWWKVALYAVIFVLPGGSLGVLLFAWIERRRSRKARTQAAQAVRPVALLAASPKARSTANHQTIAPAASICQTRPDAPPCRAAAGKQARQTTADPRV
ncbi:hypothetical protein [Paraburkholderia diazotrophica]|uniref:Uncharacterized protein n=1 Tax=Paraburkholderia diazotrophica TaxID=667676 RepID=A0A1H7EF34_9BURK|nr:hypothetical protein [Paraburkholderia diazotrophica]SEK11677.1 hypothetical protein SAMN05192539_105310 [Paraburkholderia diazotrophica]